MAEEILLKEQLTDQMIEAGAEFVHRLEETGLPFSIAMWFFDSEVNRWELMITTPWELSRGHITILEKANQALERMGPLKERIPPFSVRLLPPYRDLAKAITAKLHIGPGAPPLRYQGGIQGQYIDDALIYRSVA